MSWLEHKIPPPIVVLIAAAGMWPLAGIAPAIPLDNFWRWIVAGGLALVGLLIAKSGVRDFVRAKTTINPVNIDAASTLVTTGMFAYTRNPMYLGMTVLLLGWAVFLSGESCDSRCFPRNACWLRSSALPTTFSHLASSARAATSSSRASSSITSPKTQISFSEY
jgi:protein-S-isoprenylcysteine O-methyltransferase Ste14